MDSILTSVKKLLGISEECTDFDVDVIIHINTAFYTLSQLGVGPSGGFSISSSDTRWEDYIPDIEKLEGVKTYVYLKVRSLFDPPTSSSAMEALNKAISELEWRLNVSADNCEEVIDIGK